MKSSFSLIVPKPAIARWGNFNHTTLIKAELFRVYVHDKALPKTVEGIVRSSQDLNPLYRVSVKLKGTNLEAQTDENGWFSMIIEKPTADDMLVFTSSGFDAVHIPADEDFLHVNLKVTHKLPAKRNWIVRNFFSF